MGDGFAGFVAKLLGAPVGRILIATNANDILTRALNIGRYARAAASAATISPAMDIQVASNFERLLFVASGRDADQTRNAYDGFATSGGFDIDEATLAQAAKTFSAVAVDDAETLAAMRAAYAETGEVLCPHSAVALAAARKGAPDWKPDGQVVVLATAHPAKFPETVQQALKLDAPLPARCADLFERPEVFASLPADAGQVADYIKAHSRAHGA
jgi:threonine synthase